PPPRGRAKAPGCGRRSRSRGDGRAQRSGRHDRPSRVLACDPPGGSVREAPLPGPGAAHAPASLSSALAPSPGALAKADRLPGAEGVPLRLSSQRGARRTMSEQSVQKPGRIIEIKGVVIDAVFPEGLPEIYTALSIDIPPREGQEARSLIAEVQQH